MTKTIIIRGAEVEFAANGATPMLYRFAFQEDLLVKLQAGTEEAIFETMPKLAYIMAMQAKGIIKGLSYDGMIDWLSGFDAMAIEEVADAIVDVFYTQQETSVAAKKKGIIE